MRQRNGFTLLELLVALAVFGLLLVTLTQGVHFGLLAWRSQLRLAAANADLNEIDLTLRNLIEAIDPGSEERDRPTLQASRDAMTFVTDLPSSGSAGPPRHGVATLLVDHDHRLVLRWKPIPGLSDPGAVPEETEILRGVAGMELAFWRRGGGWVEGWRSKGLPAMVRIHLGFMNSRARHWPDIVVAPLLDRS